ncbi:MAG: MBL fold metallo-hydrolase [Fibrobacterota bacterium]|nr:MBL fold metallo-hydrolase [Fibrobacterota bacterium]
MIDSMVSIRILNHACAIIDISGVSILIDPWLMGTCFDDGWGLRYDNADAFEAAGKCTHMWISHFHGDHFHVPTLKRIAKLNPGIVCIGNVSANFRMDEALGIIGFRNVIPFYERRPLKLADDLVLERIPATSIDNMLILRNRELTLLNYNDCVLPRYTKKVLSRKIGAVDIFMSNFNHAGKLLKNPLPADEAIRGLLVDNFKNTFLPFNPRWVVPFASHHYYRDGKSSDQNSSMLVVDELKDIDDRIVPIEVGEVCRFDMERLTVSRSAVDQVKKNNYEAGVSQAAKSIPTEAILEAARKYSKKARSAFVFPKLWAGALNIFVDDLACALVLDYTDGPRFDAHLEKSACDIATRSSSLLNWLSKLYGTDSFVVGGHFDILTKDLKKIKKHIILGITIDNKIDPRSLFKMLASLSGIQFYFNRREEILGLAVNRQIGSDYQNSPA